MIQYKQAFGGQNFIPGELEKIARLWQMIGERPVLTEVDGGLAPTTAAQPREYGANIEATRSAAADHRQAA